MQFSSTDLAVKGVVREVGGRPCEPGREDAAFRPVRSVVGSRGHDQTGRACAYALVNAELAGSAPIKVKGAFALLERHAAPLEALRDAPPESHGVRDARGVHSTVLVHAPDAVRAPALDPCGRNFVPGFYIPRAAARRVPDCQRSRCDKNQNSTKGGDAS